VIILAVRNPLQFRATQLFNWLFRNRHGQFRALRRNKPHPIQNVTRSRKACLWRRLTTFHKVAKGFQSRGGEIPKIPVNLISQECQYSGIS
jgi:hypothetical protein